MSNGNSRNPHWSEARKPFLPIVKQLIDEGIALTAIAKELGVSFDFIKSCMRDLGIGKRSNSETRAIQSRSIKASHAKKRSQFLDDVSRLYHDGYSIDKISKSIGTSRTTVKSCIIDLGLPVRTGSEANKIRFSKMSDDERAELSKKANHVIRTSVFTNEHLKPAAIAKQKSRVYVGILEDDIRKRLEARGIECIPQFAWERYNIDIMAGHLAVEVHSAPTRPIYISTGLRKTVELCSAGIPIIYVWLMGKKTFSERAIDEIVRFYESTRSNPSSIGEYRVIRGNGDIDSVSNIYLDDVTAIMSRYYSLKSSGSD